MILNKHIILNKRMNKNEQVEPLFLRERLKELSWSLGFLLPVFVKESQVKSGDGGRRFLDVFSHRCKIFFFLHYIFQLISQKCLLLLLLFLFFHSAVDFFYSLGETFFFSYTVFFQSQLLLQRLNKREFFSFRKILENIPVNIFVLCAFFSTTN